MSFGKSAGAWIFIEDYSHRHHADTYRDGGKILDPEVWLWFTPFFIDAGHDETFLQASCSTHKHENLHITYYFCIAHSGTYCLFQTLANSEFSKK